MEIKDYLTLIWILCSSIPRRNCADEVAVKLVDGQADNQGKVMIRLTENGSWKPLCAKHFGDQAAAVVCRQLGYRYSLNEPGVYLPKIPDWIRKDISCHGNESNIGQCFHGNHDCFRQTDSYAAVCCSNNNDYGERSEDGLYTSHCAKTWLSAVHGCKSLGLKLTEIDQRHDAALREGEIGPVWNGKFLSPWIWSDDCVRFTRDLDYTDTHIPHNSPGACFQICGHSSGTLFVLSGSICRCIPSQDHIVAVRPSFCYSLCPGDSGRYCGNDKRVYWDLYRIGSKDDDFAVYSTQLNDTRQCAGLIQNTHSRHRLRSQACHSQYGYICSEFKSPTDKGYIPLKSPTVTLSSARQSCRNKTEAWKLAGSDVVTSTLFTHVQKGFWVDIESSMVSIYQSNNIDPDQCQTAMASSKDDSRIVYQLYDCKQYRLRYTCSSGIVISYTSTTRQTQPTSKHVRTTNLDTIIPDDDKNKKNKATGVVSVGVSGIELWQVVIAVLIGILAASLLVIIFICWKKRRRRSRNNMTNEVHCQNGQIVSISPGNYVSPTRRTSGDYDVISDANADNQPLNVYEELSDTTAAANIYNELNTEHHNLNTHSCDERPVENGDVGRKESLKMKASYSFPQDSVRDKNGLKRHSSSATDPKYSYPYDSLEKINTQLNSKSNYIIEENEKE